MLQKEVVDFYHKSISAMMTVMLMMIMMIMMMTASPLSWLSDEVLWIIESQVISVVHVIVCCW